MWIGSNGRVDEPPALRRALLFPPALRRVRRDSGIANSLSDERSSPCFSLVTGRNRAGRRAPRPARAGKNLFFQRLGINSRTCKPPTERRNNRKNSSLFRAGTDHSAGGRRGCRPAGPDSGYGRLLTNWMKGGFLKDDRSPAHLNLRPCPLNPTPSVDLKSSRPWTRLAKVRGSTSSGLPPLRLVVRPCGIEIGVAVTIRCYGEFFRCSARSAGVPSAL